MIHPQRPPRPPREHGGRGKVPLAPQGGPRGTTNETLRVRAQNRIFELCVGVFALPQGYVDVGVGM